VDTTPTRDADSGEWLPLAQAAQRLGLSLDATRQRMRRGKIEGRRVATAQGFRWEVHVGVVHPNGHLDTAPGSVHPNGSPPRDVHLAAHLGALVQVVDRLERQTETQAEQIAKLSDERAELYGRLGFLQAQLQAKDEQIKALEAPKEPPPAAPRWPEEPTPVDPPARPWWRFW
jgi:hypothetical protein